MYSCGTKILKDIQKKALFSGTKFLCNRSDNLPEIFYINTSIYILIYIFPQSTPTPFIQMQHTVHTVLYLVYSI